MMWSISSVLPYNFGVMPYSASTATCRLRHVAVVASPEGDEQTSSWVSFVA